MPTHVKQPPQFHICPICGKEFLASKTNHRSCSKRCAYTLNTKRAGLERAYARIPEYAKGQRGSDRADPLRETTRP